MHLICILHCQTQGLHMGLTHMMPFKGAQLQDYPSPRHLALGNGREWNKYLVNIRTLTYFSGKKNI